MTMPLDSSKERGALLVESEQIDAQANEERRALGCLSVDTLNLYKRNQSAWQSLLERESRERADADKGTPLDPSAEERDATARIMAADTTTIVLTQEAVARELRAAATAARTPLEAELAAERERAAEYAAIIGELKDAVGQADAENQRLEAELAEWKRTWAEASAASTMEVAQAKAGRGAAEAELADVLRKRDLVSAEWRETRAALDVANARLRVVSAGVEDVWMWTGDGQDHPESLSCPVVMSAVTLRAFVAAREECADLKITVSSLRFDVAMVEVRIMAVKEPLEAELARVRADRNEARDWVRRLTASQRLLTCAFCGEAYPPGTPESNHEALTAHVRVCAKHPMREVEREQGAVVAREREACGDAVADLLEAHERDRSEHAHGISLALIAIRARGTAEPVEAPPPAPFSHWTDSAEPKGRP